MNGHPRASVFGGILLCSLGVLMQEILLTRIFSFTIWYHFAYLTISTALLGFGVASVVATVTAVILGMQIGFSGVALVAVAVYAVGVAGMLSAIPDDQLA